MARDGQRLAGEVAGREPFAVGEQVIELGAVGAEPGLEMEDVLEDRLDAGDLRADRDPAAQLRAQPGRR